MEEVERYVEEAERLSGGLPETQDGFAGHRGDVPTLCLGGMKLKIFVWFKSDDFWYSIVMDGTEECGSSIK